MMDEGQGPAVIVIPGIQGRWEWMTPALDALLALSVSISVMMLIVSLGLVRPLDFSVFPTLLLLTTLFDSAPKVYFNTETGDYARLLGEPVIANLERSA